MSGPRILVTGGAGQLAEAIRKAWSDFDLVIPSESELDLCSPERILATVKRTRPQVVLNCGAFTQVDLCETEPDLAMADRVMLGIGTVVLPNVRIGQGAWRCRPERSDMLEQSQSPASRVRRA